MAPTYETLRGSCLDSILKEAESNGLPISKYGSLVVLIAVIARKYLLETKFKDVTVYIHNSLKPASELMQSIKEELIQSGYVTDNDIIKYTERHLWFWPFAKEDCTSIDDMYTVTIIDDTPQSVTQGISFELPLIVYIHVPGDTVCISEYIENERSTIDNVLHTEDHPHITLVYKEKTDNETLLCVAQ